MNRRAWGGGAAALLLCAAFAHFCVRIVPAEALGYEAGDARDDLDDDIEQLEEQIDAGEESDSLFDSIKRQFNSLKDRLTT